MIAKTFLRLERDFDKHVAYCRDEPLAQEFLAERDEVRNYFKVSEMGIILPNFAMKASLIQISFQMMCAIYKKTENEFSGKLKALDPLQSIQNSAPHNYFWQTITSLLLHFLFGVVDVSSTFHVYN